MTTYNLRNKIVSLAPNSVASNLKAEEELKKANAEADHIVVTSSKAAEISDNTVFVENEAGRRSYRSGSEAVCVINEDDHTTGENVNAVSMATFSAEQFQQILAAMGGNSRGGSFTQCTARYKGQRDPAAVEEFLAAISVFKDIEKISDRDALRGMPLLFEDYAASWWIGVKDTVTSFEDAKALIRITFSPPIPDWRIFSNIFELKQQKSEPTDSFICKKRLLLSQLKVPVSEEVQLNMIYGLLSMTIRERVRRENVRTFSELIAASREAEIFVTESCPATSNMNIKEENVSSSRCCFCRMKGHNIESCLKKKKRDEQLAIQQVEEQQQRQVSQPNNTLLRKPTFSCYGCGAPGVYRANCPTCSNPSKESPQYLAFNSLSSTIIGHALPTTHIEIFGLKGEAVFDSGAKTSIASLNLKKILTKNGCVFQDVRAEVTLANGSSTTGKVMHTICDVVIGGRIRKIRLVYLPNSDKSRTLLGTDFLEQAGIVLNMAQRCWYFEDDPKAKFLFKNPMEVGIFSMDLKSDECSPCSKAMNEVSKFISFVEDKKKISPLSNTPKCSNDYSPHSIQSIFRDAIPVGERTPGEISSLFGPPIKARKSEQDAYLAEVFLPLYSLDIRLLKDSDDIGLTDKKHEDLDKLLMSHIPSCNALGTVLLQGEGTEDHQHVSHPLEIDSKVLAANYGFSNYKYVPKIDSPYIVMDRIGATTSIITHGDDITTPLDTYHASDEAITPVQMNRRRGRPPRI